MPPRPNQNVGKALVLFAVGITAVGLGVGAVYLPYYSEEGKKRAAAVARGRDPAVVVEGFEETAGEEGKKGAGGSRGSMWRKR